MAGHRSTNLELRTDKAENVYRYIYDWTTVQSSHDDSAMYLLMHALVQWGPARDYPINVFSIAMQYSRTPGQEVDVSQPPHIPEDDIDAVIGEFTSFVERRRGRR